MQNTHFPHCWTSRAPAPPAPPPPLLPTTTTMGVDHFGCANPECQKPISDQGDYETCSNCESSFCIECCPWSHISEGVCMGCQEGWKVDRLRNFLIASAGFTHLAAAEAAYSVLWEDEMRLREFVSILKNIATDTEGSSPVSAEDQAVVLEALNKATVLGDPATVIRVSHGVSGGSSEMKERIAQLMYLISCWNHSAQVRDADGYLSRIAPRHRQELVEFGDKLCAVMSRWQDHINN